MVHDCFKQAQFAVAAYADFDDARPDKSALMLAGMTAAQGAEFAALWRVTEQYTDPVTGVSATLFQAATGGPRYLAVRSAPEPVDAMPDVSVPPPSAPTRLGPQYQALRSRVLRWLDEGLLAPGFTVAGHGLGGALAAALAAEFDSLVGRAYLYYADAADDAVDQIARDLGIRPGLHAAKLVRFPR